MTNLSLKLSQANLKATLSTQQTLADEVAAADPSTSGDAGAIGNQYRLPLQQFRAVMGYGGTAYVGVRAVRERVCASFGSRVVTAYPFGARVYVYFTAGGWSNIGRGRWIANYLLVKYAPRRWPH